MEKAKKIYSAGVHTHTLEDRVSNNSWINSEVATKKMSKVKMNKKQKRKASVRAWIEKYTVTSRSGNKLSFMCKSMGFALTSSVVHRMCESVCMSLKIYLKQSGRMSEYVCVSCAKEWAFKLRAAIGLACISLKYSTTWKCYKTLFNIVFYRERFGCFLFRWLLPSSPPPIDRTLFLRFPKKSNVPQTKSQMSTKRI